MVSSSCKPSSSISCICSSNSVIVNGCLFLIRRKNTISLCKLSNYKDLKLVLLNSKMTDQFRDLNSRSTFAIEYLWCFKKNFKKVPYFQYCGTYIFLKKT